MSEDCLKLLNLKMIWLKTKKKSQDRNVWFPSVIFISCSIVRGDNITKHRILEKYFLSGIARPDCVKVLVIIYIKRLINDVEFEDDQAENNKKFSWV
ncbi:unnamed protein product [Ilex paraguariensis]|uniref:Uncharacterized protein n=1 Tax=Ilex paraguariensis TaxID=185542 RepID=A0ABC8RFL6_9AQUA